MKIAYLDGYRFFRVFQVGANAIIYHQKELDRINVFPVADADTGINMAMTVEAVLSQATASKDIKATLRSISDAALMGARGNSGIILAQYLHGLSTEMPDSESLTAKNFALSAQKAVKRLYSSVMNPVEGTILTVIREWSEYLSQAQENDFCELIVSSLAKAQKSLSETPQKLKALADAKVVDAGAKGFVIFLEAVVDFIHGGSLQDKMIVPAPKLFKTEGHKSAASTLRYCSEANLGACSIDIQALKALLAPLGDSLIVAGDPEKMRLHIHSNFPEKVFDALQPLSLLSSIKVDDMKRQHETSHEQKYPIGIITDSACDLPQELMDFYQISCVPFGVNFGKELYLDQLTLKPEAFYQKLKNHKIHPQSSQPPPSTVQSMIEHMAENYDKVFAIHISDKLSGTYQSAASFIANKHENKVHPVNSRQLSVSEGLVVLRVARAIEAGESFQSIHSQLDTWIANAHIYTDIYTLKYMVRGGRVPALAGIIASLLNLKPIVGLDREGKAQISGKSFSRASNMRKIIKTIQGELHDKKLWKYAIVHAEARDRAEEYAHKLTKLLGKSPAYIMPLTPVVGVHNGIGAVGIGVIYDPV
ncbi:MAG: DegV family protein [Candidatus Cloacimonadaceae bacterium]|jgi:DegV family protein with EDD domain|nr:DegV family EDD domain-containing protein [Candidatus Cloacimonadota bacterium]MCB5254740.1 DegV family EDD domain-containing protein [Candidatus Cloacimonadota bacterium]MCK9178230.1 DegV family EDD domain-containing protein [Candidatus Cloacimonadota bacterium]MCK9241733.1 DegV family EDD domain-containing protein [Candidatus Cloacimonadota bacterium]MDY0127376.1 DegV family protein [Candidatus Cloacimonadaceae bacterium]